MVKVAYIIEYYITASGEKPFLEWLSSVDYSIERRINKRLNQIFTGNLGNYKYLIDGVYEFKLDFGAGYRIYFAIENKKIILLLCGGDKSSQKKDIKKL